jgi:hypothetical protein
MLSHDFCRSCPSVCEGRSRARFQQICHCEVKFQDWRPTLALLAMMTLLVRLSRKDVGALQCAMGNSSCQCIRGAAARDTRSVIYSVTAELAH